MSTANKALSRRFTELFSTGDEGLADEVLAPDIVFHGTTGDGELRRKGTDDSWEIVRAWLRSHPVWSLMLQDPFIRRANEKPRGYPGDSEMMRMIYEDGFVGTPRDRSSRSWRA